MCALGCFWLVSLSCWRNNCNNFSLRVAVLPPLFFYEYFSFFRLASSQLLTLPNYKSLQFFYNLLCFSFCIVCLCLSLHFICSFSLFFLFVLCPQLPLQSISTFYGQLGIWVCCPVCLQVPLLSFSTWILLVLLQVPFGRHLPVDLASVCCSLGWWLFRIVYPTAVLYP